jgi:hypothetical protein
MTETISAAAYRRLYGRDRRAALVEGEHPRLLRPPAPPRERVPEAEFQGIIVAFAERMGWWTYHTRDSIGSNPGWPDLVLARYEGPHCRVLFRELKTAKGKLRPEQLAWGQRLMAAGLDWKVWRPDDWDEICDTLAQR